LKVFLFMDHFLYAKSSLCSHESWHLSENSFYAFLIQFHVLVILETLKRWKASGITLVPRFDLSALLQALFVGKGNTIESLHNVVVREELNLDIDADVSALDFAQYVCVDTGTPSQWPLLACFVDMERQIAVVLSFDTSSASKLKFTLTAIAPINQEMKPLVNLVLDAKEMIE